MILQSLRDLAMRERLLTNPDYEPKPVAWIIHVGDGGQFAWPCPNRGGEEDECSQARRQD